MDDSLERTQAAALRARALRHLSQREHSRKELERKLLRAGARQAAMSVEDDADRLPASDAATRPDPAELAGPDAEARAAAVRQILDDLGAQGLQSDDRTVEALIAARAGRWGARRLQAEMQRRGIAPELIGAALTPLAGSELERARALWQRRFGTVAAGAAERARQARYLAGRGFSMDVIQRVVRGLDPDDR